jgi:hypothetical protein
MKALISLLFGTWMLALCGGLQAQTRVVTTTEPVFSRAELDQMLAPIALYPDTVLSHILIAATYPLEVIEAERWISSNRHLEAEDAVNAAALEGWDPSVAALTAFPDLLSRMSDDLKWTQNLGDAFLADEARIMDVIQHLREKAYASGQLKKMKHVKVQREKQIIVIEPAVERVVYVPYYDTRVVYGPWWWDTYPPVYWQAPASFVHVGGVYWGPRVYLGSTFFFSSVHWPERRIVVIDYRHQHHRHPHFYSGRKIAHYQGARRWEHNPVHRRNIVYRSEPVRQRYSNADGSRRFSREWRNEQRDQRRDTQPPRSDNKRDGQQRHSVTRERLSEGRPSERREQGQLRNREQASHDLPRPGHIRSPEHTRPREQNNKRAEEVRLRLENKRANETPRGGESHAERRNKETPATRRDDPAPRERADLQNRQEHQQREQSENTKRNWQAERRERTQSQQEARRDIQTRRESQTHRTENQPRHERTTQPQRTQQEQRRFEPSRGQREGPRPERGEQRRFER